MKKNILKFVTSIILGLTMILGLNIEDAKALTSLTVNIDQDTTINDDVVVLRNENITVEKGCTLTINGNLYVLGSFTNYGEVTISNSLYCLNYNSFMSAGDYSYGQFYNYKNLNVTNLNVTDSWINSLNTTGIQEFEPYDSQIESFLSDVNVLPDHYQNAYDNIIHVANIEYQNLPDEKKGKKSVVEAYQVLDRINQEKARVDNCLKLLQALPSAENVSASDREAIQTARQSYNALGDLLQINIAPNYTGILENDEKRLESLAADQTKVDDVTAKINAINTADTATLKSQYTNALDAYNALSDEQKKLVSSEVLNKLNSAKAKIDELEKQAKDNQSKANDVIAKINAINTANTVTLKSQYTNALDAYNALSESQKKLISADVVAKLNNAKTVLDQEATKTAGTPKSSEKTSNSKDQKASQSKNVQNNTAVTNQKNQSQSTATTSSNPTSAPTKKTQTAKMKTKVKKIKLTMVNIKSVKSSKKSLTVTWKKVKNAKKYQVAYKVAKGKWKTVTVTKLKYKALKLKSKKKYSVRVRAINGKVKGKWSKVKTVKVK